MHACLGLVANSRIKSLVNVDVDAGLCVGVNTCDVGVNASDVGHFGVDVIGTDADAAYHRR